MNSVTLNAYAKINPALDVTGRRPDGYHEVRMLLQQIELHDVIRIRRTDVPGIRLTVLPAPGSSSGGNGTVFSAAQVLPTDEGNIAYRAAKLLTDTYDIASGADITLEKRIPVAAGLAGGSTDAAAVLKGMNTLFSLGLSQEELRALGLTLGADVPFCIMGGGALAEGIGEILTPLPPMPQCRILLVKPPEGISTGAVYRALDALEDPPHPDIDAVLSACAAGDLSALCRAMGNILESVTFEMLPRLRQIGALLIMTGAKGAMMSGSGPTMFGLYPDAAQAGRAKGVLQRKCPDCEVILTQFRSHDAAG